MSQPNIDNPDPILTVPDAAAYLGVSEYLVREEVRVGRLRGVRIGRFLRVRVSALEEYLNAASR